MLINLNNLCHILLIITFVQYLTLYKRKIKLKDMKILLITIITLFSSLYVNAQTESNDNLKLYYDCQYCDVTFIKQNLDYIEFVRDRKFSDVHLLITNQQNGSGAKTYTLQFMGKGKYLKHTDTLMYSTNPDMTSDETRRLQLRYIEMGLMRFLLEKGLDNKIELSYVKDVEKITEVVIDPWRNWVFRVSLRGWFSGQETSSNSNVNSSVSAKRVTDKNKFSLYSNVNQNRSSFIYDDTVEYTSFNQNLNLYVNDVFSLNNKLSAGLFGDVSKSIYSNYKLSTGVRGGVEYNLFPYSESATKQAVVYYTIGTRFNDYFDTTFYNKTQELLFEHSLLVGTSIKQKWGNVRASVKYKNYLHDFELNSIDFDLNFNVNLLKGLSWRINGRYSIQHDQINIEKPSGQSEIDLLLSQKQFKSGFDYWFSTGLSYSFGSIYNTIVNPRFDF